MSSGENKGGGTSWCRDDDIAFERALAIYTEGTENRWEKIASVVQGKTIEQIVEHYEVLLRDVMMIESGCVPLPDYDFLEETNDEEEGKSKPKQKRRKGIAWTANEHSQFLLGLNKYGKGDWRSISRHFVVTRTPTQVASHAQKYFARLNSKDKSKKRSSIHDVTWQNTQAIQATPQPSVDHPTYDTPTTWNTQATSQPSLDRSVYGTPTIWNAQAASQPSVYNPTYGTPTVGQSMVGPMVSPFGSDMNPLATPHMAYGVQQYSVPYSSVPSAPFNLSSSIPYNMTYVPNFR